MVPYLSFFQNRQDLQMTTVGVKGPERQRGATLGKLLTGRIDQKGPFMILLVY